MNNYAYISLISSNGYIYPAIEMMTSWKRVHSKYPFYLMVTEDISEENCKILSFLGYKLIHINEYIPKTYLENFNKIQSGDLSMDSGKYSFHDNTATGSGWRHAFSKLLIWKFIEFDKVCWLDLDILIFKNIDDVFNYQTPAWLEPNEDNYVFSQMFVVKPNLEIFNQLIEYADQYQNPYEWHQVLFTDECVLNSFWEKQRQHILKSDSIPLLYSYPLDKTNTNYKNVLNVFLELRGVHLTEQVKPWVGGLQYVRDFTPDWFIGSFIWQYYIHLLNQGIKELNSVGFQIKKIDW